ncbi:helix-turn-helix domain-containing protein [Carboxydothermus pertinax]|uniref:Helix-turn-helix domain-containing protein n=1 Tax=Carboxydothermus pertinax TaxID=870242 RepID=A0A1L8CYU0_9THEO|nr:helix-turn-helix domain-containing protein [Carboxydothermus pertinax]GAV24034.1 helix-turn-helix domain-containing protein [Carboxydothermus pertinax]
MPSGRPIGGKNRYYSKEFKLEVINRCLAGESTHALGKEYSINRSLICSWIKRFREKGPEALENKKKPGNPFAGMQKKKNLSEVERLRFELAKAEVELAKLKKLYEIERRVAQRKK